MVFLLADRTEPDLRQLAAHAELVVVEGTENFHFRLVDVDFVAAKKYHQIRTLEYKLDIYIYNKREKEVILEL